MPVCDVVYNDDDNNVYLRARSLWVGYALLSSWVG